MKQLYIPTDKYDTSKMGNRKIWFTSDIHFGHVNILKFQEETRLGTDINDMNEIIIANWNSQVALHDIVYVTGDFSFIKGDRIESILKRLNGEIHLVLGNHEHWLNSITAQYFESITSYKKLLIDKIYVVLFHFPLVEWDRMQHGSFFLHGHTHGSFQHEGKSLDIGIDGPCSVGMKLVEWKTVVEYMKDRPVVKHHNKYGTD